LNKETNLINPKCCGCKLDQTGSRLFELPLKWLCSRALFLYPAWPKEGVHIRRVAGPKTAKSTPAIASTHTLSHAHCLASFLFLSKGIISQVFFSFFRGTLKPVGIICNDCWLRLIFHLNQKDFCNLCCASGAFFPFFSSVFAACSLLRAWKAYTSARCAFNHAPTGSARLCAGSRNLFVTEGRTLDSSGGSRVNGGRNRADGASTAPSDSEQDVCLSHSDGFWTKITDRKKNCQVFFFLPFVKKQNTKKQVNREEGSRVRSL